MDNGNSGNGIGGDATMTIQRVPTNLLASNMYLVEESGHAIVIDPCMDTSTVNPSITYDRIILTHEHYDHISGIDLWREKTGARVFCSRSCGENIKDPKKNTSQYFEAFCELQTWMPYEGGRTYDPFSSHADEVFEERTELEWQGHRLELFETPGHSEGSICILLDGTKLFAGDSLIPGRGPELRFPGGSRKRWKEKTLPILRELSPEIKVFPGHLKPCGIDEFSEYLR